MPNRAKHGSHRVIVRAKRATKRAQSKQSLRSPRLDGLDPNEKRTNYPSGVTVNQLEIDR